MGLASALSTALTGLQAAETVIDVSGNNLANSNTVGFKSSEAVFATQFLQTQSLGSSPTEGSGGTNPRQIGLGTQVAEITPDFTQGTIEVSSSPSDLAIQGDGFFVVQGGSGETLYSRNGILKLNSSNELVTTTGDRLMGHGVDSNFNIQTTELVPLTIPLGNTQVAQATQNVLLEGTLIPTGEVANQAQVIQSAIMGDASLERPTAKPSVAVALTPPTAGSAAASNNSTTGNLSAGETYLYKFTFVDAAGNETLPSTDTIPTPSAVTIGVGDDSVSLTGIPVDPTAGTKYESVNIYRTTDGAAGTYYLAGTADVSGGVATFVDEMADATLTGNATLNEDTITGNYSYYATFYNSGNQTESRPSLITDPVNVNNGRVHLTGLPTPTTAGVYDSVRIYRNLETDSSSFFLVDAIGFGKDFTDSKSDGAISDLAISGNKALDLDGPKIQPTTLLVNITKQTGNSNSLSLAYESLFTEGTLSFVGEKGGRSLLEKTFAITSTSTAIDLVNFMNSAMGIQGASNDLVNPIPGSIDASNPTNSYSTGGSITGDGKIQFVGNNGVDNAISIGLSAFTLAPTTGGNTKTPQLNFGVTQTAVGESVVTDFVAYDTLGIKMDVRVTAILESSDGAGVTYRWFADSPDNDPSTGANIAVGTGLITFDGEGNIVPGGDATISIERQNVPSTSPSEFKLDLSSLSGLASSTGSSLAASGQDGSSPGTLSSFIIGEDGTIRGVFSNGVTRDLGQIRLARFANPNGLEQRGQNLFSSSVNSGLAIEGNPGEQGIGTVRAGAVELSNTDVGQNLIDLILASTQYRSNTRVINSAQQLLDELLNLRR